jgi:hypothetical protein
VAGFGSSPMFCQRFLKNLYKIEIVKKRKNSVKNVRAIVDLSHTRVYAALERGRGLVERRRLRVGLFRRDRVKILEKSLAKRSDS